MTGIAGLLQQADWKKEKHVPTIDCPEKVTAGEAFMVKASVGKEVAHPNTTEHHISYITLLFLPEGAKQAIQVGHYEFTAHGESGAGPNEGPVFAMPKVKAEVTLKTSGTLYALSLCNIHGLWESSKQVTVA